MLSVGLVAIAKYFQHSVYILPVEKEGYIEIRDCSGEIQREETCPFCGGTGCLKEKKNTGELFDVPKE